MIVTVQGYELKLYTIGHTAKLLKTSPETLRKWEKEGILPKPMFKYGNNVRLYHPKEVSAIGKVMRNKTFRNRYRVKEKLKHEMWANLTKAREEILSEINREDQETHSKVSSNV